MDHSESSIQSVVDDLNDRYEKKISVVKMGASEEVRDFTRHCLAISDSLDPNSVLRTVRDTELSHLVQTSNPVVENEMYASAQIIADANAFFSCPIKGILRPKINSKTNTNNFQMVFNSSKQKNDFLEGLKIYLSGFVKRESTIDEILLIADEMFSNAIFNAPYINSVGAKGVNRNEGEVTSDKSAVFLAGCTDNQLALCCIDQYGSLDLNALLERIYKCYDQGAEEVMDKTGKGGAGLGVFLVFDGSSSLYSLVKPGKFTLMANTIPLGLSRKKKQMIQKSLHCSLVEDEIDLEHLFQAS